MNNENDNYNVALNRVAAYCSKAERCKWDVLQRLKKFDLSNADVCKIISWLEKEGFLNEERYCTAFVNDKVKFSHWGRLKIQQALRQKRIADHLIEKVLQNINQSLYMENLANLMAKKRLALDGESPFVLQSKLVKYAMGRGFIYSEIEQALRDNGMTPDFF